MATSQSQSGHRSWTKFFASILFDEQNAWKRKRARSARRERLRKSRFLACRVGKKKTLRAANEGSTTFIERTQLSGGASNAAAHSFPVFSGTRAFLAQS